MKQRVISFVVLLCAVFTGAWADDWTVNIPDGTVSVSSSKANSVVAATSADDNTHWYVMQQDRDGLTPVVAPSATDGAINRESNALSSYITNGVTSTTNAKKYLVRLVPSGTNNVYYIQFGTGLYFGHTAATLTLNSGSGTALNGRTYANADKYFIYNIASSDTHIGVSYTANNSAHTARLDNNGKGNGLSYWTSGQKSTTGGNDDWSFYAVDFDFTAQTAQLTYKYTNGGQTWFTANAQEVIVGQPYPDLALPYGVTGTKPAGNVPSGDATVEIPVTYTKGTRGFDFSADYEHAKWHKWYKRYSWQNSVRSELFYVESANYINQNKDNTDNTTDEYLWAAVGNPFDFVIINRAAGSGKYLSNPNNSVSDANEPYMQEQSAKTQHYYLYNCTNAGNTWGDMNFCIINAATHTTLSGNSHLNYWVNNNAWGDDGSRMIWEWVMDEPEASIEQTYTIHILGLPGTDGITVDYDGQAKSDGAEVVGAGLTASAFTNATAVAGYTPTITVLGTNVNVTYRRDDVAFDSTHEYNGSATIKYERAVASIKIGEVTKDIKEYETMSEGTSFKAYRDLTESIRFTIEANTTTEFKVTLGTTSAWAGGYLYIDNDKDGSFINNAEDAPIATIKAGSGITNFANLSSSFSLSEPGEYRARLVIDNKENGQPHDLNVKGREETISNPPCGRIVDFIIVVPDKDWDAYNTKLTFLNQVVLGTKLGQYTCEVNGQEVNASALSMYREAWQESYDGHNNSYYDNNMDEMDTYIAGMRLNMPQDGTFIRIHGYDDATSKYLLGTESANSKLNVGGRNDGGGRDAVFYYKDGKLLAYTNGQYADVIRNEAGIDILSLAEVGSEGVNVTFRAALGGSVGAYNLIAGNGIVWIGPSAIEATGSTDNSNRLGSNWRLQLEEANELPVAIGSTGFATFYTPVTVVVPPSIKAYVCHLEGENLSVYTCKQTTNIEGNDYVVIPAETAVMIKGSSSNMIIRENVEAEAYDNNSFFGDVATKAFESMGSDTYYSLQRDQSANDGTVGFFVKPSGNFKGFQAFLSTSASQAPVQRFNVTFDEDAVITGIANVLGTENINIPAFDLSGRKVDANSHRGLYIMNGKKVIR